MRKKIWGNINLLTLFLLIILILGAFLRFSDLGYSNYQGDEVKALFNVRNNKEFYEFIFDQRKGPNQFLVTYLFRGISNNYYNEFIVRLPFAIAGFLSIIVFHFVVKNFFDSKAALFSSIFFASSGFLVAFSRIVQYQSFVILFGLLTILMGQLFLNSKKYFYLYLGFISLSISILFHYDGIFFGLAFILIILLELKKDLTNKKLIVNSLLSGLLSIVILASFYIPFVLNIDNATLEYFQERIEGVGGGSKISSSIFNFNLYQPYLSFYLYLFLGFWGLFYLVKNYRDNSTFITAFWFLAAFTFMEILIESPGTHVYTYLIPAMIILGLGLNLIFENVKNKMLFYSTGILVFAVSLHLFLQSYVLLVENTREYPWQDKKYLYFDLKRLTQDDNQNYYLSVFGFPYNRNWQEIGNFLKEEKGFYDSSEKSSISNFYVPNLKFKDKAEIYVEVEHPQSFSRANRREFTPVKVFENPNGTKSFIYFLK